MKDRFRAWCATLRVPGRPNEFEAKRLLAETGLSVPRGRLLAPDDPVTPLGGADVCVLKVCSPDILHKTDVNGVLMNVTDDTLAAAAEDLRGRFPGKPLLLEAQAPVGTQEVIVGAIKDPVFGLAVMVGAGGVLTEVYKDVAFRLPPFGRREASRMLADLRIHPVFSGYRGIDLDPAQLAGLLASVGDLAVALGERLEELDINPLVFCRGRWTVLDAKLILTPQ